MIGIEVIKAINYNNKEYQPGAVLAMSVTSIESMLSHYGDSIKVWENYPSEPRRYYAGGSASDVDGNGSLDLVEVLQMNDVSALVHTSRDDLALIGRWHLEEYCELHGLSKQGNRKTLAERIISFCLGEIG